MNRLNAIKSRTIIYLKNFLNHRKGEIEIVDLDMALNMLRQGIADIYEVQKNEVPRKEDLQQLAGLVR